MRVRLTAGALVTAAIGLTVAITPSAAAETSGSAFGSRLVTLINDARAQHGLRALATAAGTSSVATTWTQHLVSQQALSHNPNLAAQLESHGSPDWTTYGENVGEGPSSSADDLFQAYMNSPEHRANILDPQFRYVGVGVEFDGSLAWNTLDFVDQYSSTTRVTSGTTTVKATTTKTVTSAPRVTRTTTKTPTTAKHVTSSPTPMAARHAATPRPVSRPPAARPRSRTAPALRRPAVARYTEDPAGAATSAQLVNAAAVSSSPLTHSHGPSSALLLAVLAICLVAWRQTRLSMSAAAPR